MARFLMHKLQGVTLHFRADKGVTRPLAGSGFCATGDKRASSVRVMPRLQ